MTSDLSEQVQQAVLTLMDKRTFKADNLLKVESAEAWADAKANPGSLRVVGQSCLDILVGEVLIKYVELNRKDNASHYTIVEDVLKSDITINHVLFAAGAYQNVPPCPWYGMTSDMPAASFKVYLGMYSVEIFRVKEAKSPRPTTENDDDGVSLEKMDLWFKSIFERLADAAVAALP